jgi:hypothetical protein
VIGEIAGWNDAGPGELRGPGTCWLEFRAFYLRATLAIFFGSGLWREYAQSSG